MRDARRDARCETRCEKRDETRCDFHVKELLTHKVAISCEKVLRKLGLILTDAICNFCVKIASRLVSHLVSHLVLHLVLNASSCLIRVNRPLSIQMHGCKHNSLLPDATETLVELTNYPYPHSCRSIPNQ
jgi:hypothetical protein